MNEDELMSHQSFDLLIGDMDSVVYRACCACPEGSPDTHAFHNLKNIVDKMLDVVRPEAFVFYLSGDKNYRYDIATIRPYKGNRKQPKPVWFYETREYLMNNWGAEVTDGIEADDACAIEQTKALDNGEISVIASIDKDLLQVPGWNFNYTTNHFKHVTELEGWYNFYHQMLVGDVTDNICGVTGVGKKNAERILKGATNRADLHQRVENEYKRVYGSDWDRVMLENGRLLYLQRKEGDVWNLYL